jgi:pSer/pThr/pTyr-binding forkhead associated (FHA) protein
MGKKMTAALVTIGRKGLRKEFAVEASPLVIGRKVDADLRIPQAEVSRAHCEIAINGKKLTIRDLGSSNGTFVNDQRVKQANLNPGDRVRIGSVVFVVQVDGLPKDVGKLLAGSPPATTAAPQKAKGGPPAKAAASASAGSAGGGADTDAFDIDELGELDIDELSDLDLDKITDEALEEEDAVAEEDSATLEEVEDIEEVEEIDEAELLAEDEPETKPKKK